MISPARRTAFRILTEVGLASGFADALLASPTVDALDQRDRRLVTEIVYGTLRWQGTLDAVLAQASARPWADVDAKVRILLRMALYQMWRMERVPDRAAVHESVELCKRAVGRGSEGFANGVLRRLSRERPWKREGFDGTLSDAARVSLPEWLWGRWRARFGPDRAADYASSLNQPPRRTLRLDPEPTVLAQGIAGPIERSEVVPTAAFAAEMPPEGAGVGIQDEASQLVAHLFGPMPGASAWDACAAPGGKSAILRRLVGDSGRLVASDVDLRRVVRLRQVADLQGLAGLVVADASHPPPFARRFDAVLADVPCSGLGTLRRNPEIKWRVQERELARLAELQGRILEEVSAAVAPGGRLLYSTCSTEPEENEEIVGRFLAAHAEFRLEPPRSPRGIERWTDAVGMVRTFPEIRLWDGFFAALMARKG